jgi:PAS domain-containing protein
VANVKLVVVAGPNRGATYFFEEGESVIGRAAENQVVLASTQVSKKHCAVVIQNRKVELRDLGSSNGTFVNGVLTKRKLLTNNDRISVGPFVMEVIMPEAAAKLEFGQPSANADSMAQPVSIDPGHFKLEDEQPKSLVGRYKKKFDDVFLPVLYDFYERMEYANLLAAMFSVFVILNLGFTVYPVLQRSREEVLRQAEHQAQYISGQVAQLNRQAILEGREGALQTDFADSEIHVREVVIANLEGRIQAPGARLNESFQNPYFLKYIAVLQKNQNLWGKPRTIRLPDREEIIAFTPIMVLSKAKGINVPGAVATVVYSTAAIALDSGTVGTVYLEALFWSGLLGVVFLYLLFMVSHKPIEKLNDDMDKALKGETDSVEKKYKNEIIDQLIDTVNSALSRIPRDGKQGGADPASVGDEERMVIDNMMRPVELLALKSLRPMLILDPEYRIKVMNAAFEELTGIRGALGEVIDTVSRDESFPSLLKELMENATNAGNEGVSEEYDFPSGGFKIHCVALAPHPGRPEASMYIFEKQGD